MAGSDHTEIIRLEIQKQTEVINNMHSEQMNLNTKIVDLVKKQTELQERSQKQIEIQMGCSKCKDREINVGILKLKYDTIIQVLLLLTITNSVCLMNADTIIYILFGV